MATIQKTQDEKTFLINNWLGLHESPDGDAELATGEASAMKNLTITVDGNLKTRPGLKEVMNFGTQYKARAMWSGIIDGVMEFIVLYGKKIYRVWDANNECFFSSPQLIGEIDVYNKKDAYFFPFGSYLYLLARGSDGLTNKKGFWYIKRTNGVLTLTEVTETTAYWPIVLTNCKADGTGEVFENVNRLSNYRRLWINGDAESLTYQITDSACVDVDIVYDRATGYQVTGWTYSSENNQITFDGVLYEGYNNYEIVYHTADCDKETVYKMRYGVLHSGSTDNCLCLWGDGSSRFIYSGVRYDNGEQGLYFPDLYEATVGNNNDPITAMARNYSQLLIFKTRETYTSTFSYTTLENELSTPMWTIYPVNTTIGSDIYGEVPQCENAPYTYCNGRVYEWRNQSGRSSSITRDERHAKYKSEKIYKSMLRFNDGKTWMWDCNLNGELFICNKTEVFVYRYNQNIWYYYKFNTEPVQFMEFEGKIYLLVNVGGSLLEFADNAITDLGEVIEQYWESGSMSFGSPHMRKSTKSIWLTMIPRGNTEVTVEIETDRVGSEREKTAYRQTFTFSEMVLNEDFNFIANSRARTHKLKVKAKKFTHYKLKLKCDTIGKGMDVLSFVTEYRETGEAK